MILYKYVVSDRIDILAKGLIRFTQASSLNDPFETRPYVDALVTQQSVAPTIDEFFALARDNKALYEQEYNRVLEEVAKEYGILAELMEQVRAISPYEALAQAREIAEPILKQFLGLEKAKFKQQAQEQLSESLAERFGILSLSQDPDNLLMWAHYADCHTGFVLGLDSSHPFFDQRINERDQIRKIRKVKYSGTRPSFSGLDLQGNGESQILKLASDFFLTKSDHWSYENEWRMLMEVSDAHRALELPNDTIYLFSLPPDAITSVTYGCKMDELHKERILSVLRRNDQYEHVAMYQATVDMREFRLTIEPIENAI